MGDCLQKYTKIVPGGGDEIVQGGDTPQKLMYTVVPVFLFGTIQRSIVGGPLPQRL